MVKFIVYERFMTFASNFVRCFSMLKSFKGGIFMVKSMASFKYSVLFIENEQNNYLNKLYMHTFYILYMT